jgi:hypothetical protein
VPTDYALLRKLALQLDEDTFVTVAQALEPDEPAADPFTAPDDASAIVPPVESTSADDEPADGRRMPRWKKPGKLYSDLQVGEANARMVSEFLRIGRADLEMLVGAGHLRCEKGEGRLQNVFQKRDVEQLWRAAADLDAVRPVADTLKSWARLYPALPDSSGRSLTIPEAAELLGVKEGAFRREFVYTRAIPVYRNGSGHLVVLAADMQKEPVGASS